jgi:cell division protein FtsI (penicillin-binding protein 3)
VAALVNGGYLMRPTFLKRSEEEARKNATQVIKPETSEAMRCLMRLNAEIGTAKKVNVPGFYVGGKTGTAEKAIHGHYVKNRLFTTFMAVMPADKPKYLFLTLMDEPQGLPETHGEATAAWNSGWVTGEIIKRVAPILGMAPHADPTQPFPLLAKQGYSCSLTPAVASATAAGAH